MKPNKMLAAGVFAFVLALSTPVTVPAVADQLILPDCTLSLNPCTIAMTADADEWELDYSNGLTCDVARQTGSGSAPSFQLACTHVNLVVSGEVCVAVTAETETWQTATSDAIAECGDELYKHCESASSGSSGYDHCKETDDEGESSQDMSCDLDPDPAWWDYGSRATASCTYWVVDSN